MNLNCKVCMHINDRQTYCKEYQVLLKLIDTDKCKSHKPKGEKTCDNTSHTGGRKKAFKVLLIEDLDSIVCYWCNTCIDRDMDMIEEYEI